MKSLVYQYDFKISSEGSLRGLRLGGRKPDVQYFQTDLKRPLQPTLWNTLPAPALDLLDLVPAVAAADRLSLRRLDRNGFGWTRHLTVAFPVREPDFWRQNQVTERIRCLLSTLTGDEWIFEWRPRAGPEKYADDPSQQSLLEVGIPSTAFILLSGGLDSLAGACDLLLAGENPRYAFVSVGTSDRVAEPQRKVYLALRDAFPGRSYPVEWRLELSDSLPGLGLHRTRSFVFQALGAIAAHAAGSEVLYQCENGIASLCLPLVVGSFSWQTARGVHPRVLKEMSEFLSLVFGAPFRIANPCLLLTKARMCAAIPAAGLEPAIGDTVSCDRFPQRVAGHPACGKCGPCILRRLSLHASGLESFDRTDLYRYDVTAAMTTVPEKGRIALAAMLGQQERIRYCLAAPQPWLALIEVYPELEATKRYISKATGKNETLAQHDICSMLASYLQEWASFPICTDFPKPVVLGDSRRVRSDGSFLPTQTLLELAVQAN
jgi:hypothetical protein